MSDTFTVTTKTSWLTRLKNSVIGALLGLLLIVVMVVLLFWNEGRAVQTARSLAEGAGIVVDVPAAPVDAANEGRLVHVSGDVATPHRPADETFGISAEGVRLERRAEMFQWKESSETRTQDKLGGGQESTTTYSYSKAWDDSPVDSSRFKQPAGHENPPMEIVAKDFQVPEAGLGAFQLSPRVVSMIPAGKELAVSPDQTAAIDAAYSGNKRVTVSEGRIYLGFNSTAPAVGDYRISYRLAPLGPVSIVARQAATGFDDYQTEAGDALLMVATGTVPAEKMFKDAETANMVVTWLLRVVGLVFLCVGFSLTMLPLQAVAMVLPPVGRLIGAGTGLVGTVLGIVVGAGTIALAWFWYRPLLALGIIAAGLAIALLLGRIGGRRARMAASPAAA
ncbi:MAG: TMEM43 family protein [Rhizobiales bacterium]|nr:TMEM43 family protein [Hyphomicrobiales bacterium]